MPPGRKPIQETWSNKLPDEPIHIAIIGGTGLSSLPGFHPTQTLEINTPWGQPSAPITILEHVTPAKTIKVAFLARHGTAHSYPPHEIPNRANIAALRKIGVRTIIAFSAVGSLKEEIAPCDFVIPDQIIDRTKGVRPWTFFEDGMVGHAGFSDPFDVELCKVIGQSLAPTIASDSTEHFKPNPTASPLKVHEKGILVCMEGPQFSTRAESNLYRSWGGSVINMSAVPESKLAAEAEIAYAMVCMATDYDCWRVDASGSGEGGVHVEMVVQNMKTNSQHAKVVAGAIIEKLTEKEYEPLIKSEHLAGSMKMAGACTAEEGRNPVHLEKLEWLFEADYFTAPKQIEVLLQEGMIE